MRNADESEVEFCIVRSDDGVRIYGPGASLVGILRSQEKWITVTGKLVHFMSPSGPLTEEEYESWLAKLKDDGCRIAEN